MAPAATDSLMANSPAMRSDNLDGRKLTKVVALYFKNELKTPQTLINIIIMTTAVVTLVLAEYGVIPSTQLGFFCNDPLFSHKYEGEIITPEILGVTAVLVPGPIILFIEYLTVGSWRKLNWYRLFFLFREMIVGGALTLALTEVGKLVVGEHRPHFFDVCQPDTAVNCTPGTYIKSFTCTSKDYTSYFLVDSSRSFPSGHASTTMFGGVVLAYIIHSRLPIEKTGHHMRSFLISTAFTWSLVCGLTRITDRRHHWWDVLLGSVLGGLLAIHSIAVIRSKLPIFDAVDADDNNDEQTRQSLPLSVQNRTTENEIV